MEVRIRLQRAGNSAQKTYNYRIVAIPKARARQSRVLEILGHYNAADKKDSAISINLEKLQRWIDQGAQMSETVKGLVKRMTKNSK